MSKDELRNKLEEIAKEASSNNHLDEASILFTLLGAMASNNTDVLADINAQVLTNILIPLTKAQAEAENQEYEKDLARLARLN